MLKSGRGGTNEAKNLPAKCNPDKVLYPFTGLCVNISMREKGTKRLSHKAGHIHRGRD